MGEKEREEEIKKVRGIRSGDRKRARDRIREERWKRWEENSRYKRGGRSWR